MLGRQEEVGRCWVGRKRWAVVGWAEVGGLLGRQEEVLYHMGRCCVAASKLGNHVSQGRHSLPLSADHPVKRP